MTEGDCPRPNASGTPLLKDVRCIINDTSRLFSLTKYQVDEAKFAMKYGRILHVLKVPVLSSAIKSMIHFWDPDYRRFTFQNVDKTSTIKEYSVLAEFLEDAYKVYFRQRIDGTMDEVAKLLGIPQLILYREKDNFGGLRWK